MPAIPIIVFIELFAYVFIGYELAKQADQENNKKGSKK